MRFSSGNLTFFSLNVNGINKPEKPVEVITQLRRLTNNCEAIVMQQECKLAARNNDILNVIEYYYLSSSSRDSFKMLEV